MSKSALKIIILLILTLSSGYIIKNGHICGPQTPKIDQAFLKLQTK